MLILMAFLLALIPCAVMAHPPAAMQISYDPGAGELTVAITHRVEDPTGHFVYLVEIEKNGQVLERREYSEQPTQGTFTYRYPVSAIPGDSLAVTASCNLGGTITREMAVPGTTAEETQPVQSVQSLLLWHYHAILVVLGLICFLVAAVLVQWGRSTSGWYAYHKAIATLGGIFAIIAFLIPFSMIFMGGAPAGLLVHAWLGIGIVLLVVLILVLGIARERAKKPNPSIRSAHILAGRLLVVLMIVNLLYGLVLMGVI